ncbi:MAG: urease accessory protein UreE [Hyphomicrobiaceae bacterium]
MQRALIRLSSEDPRVAKARFVITLKREDRYRRRVMLTTDCGQPFLLDLAEATYFSDGDAMVLDNQDIIIVRAAPERLLAISAPDPSALMKIAWHIGNRHTPAEVTLDVLYIKHDHVLADMVIRLGGTATLVERAFEPEGGAYGGQASMEHSHHHHDGRVHQKDRIRKL